MPELNTLKPEQHIKLLLFGDSGSGKTCFASGWPGPIHYADFDGKVNSAAAFLAGDPKLNEISYENYAPTDNVGSAGAKFNADMGKMRKEGKLPATLVLDSLTTFSDEMMRYLMKLNPGIKRMDTKGAATPAMQDYQVARLFFKQVLGELLNLPCNLVVTAHIQMDKDEVTGEILRTPMLAGKLSRELPIIFPEVYRSYVKDGKYMAQTKSDSKYQCRTQIQGLPADIELKYESLIKKY